MFEFSEQSLSFDLAFELCTLADDDARDRAVAWYDGAMAKLGGFDHLWSLFPSLRDDGSGLI